MGVKWYLAAFGVCLVGAGSAVGQGVFSPGGATVTLAVTGTTGSVQIQTSGASPTLRIYNAGTVAAFVQCGGSGVTAAVASGLPVAPGSVEVIGCGQQYVAAITGGTAATIYLTPGAGE